jgi:hypothetical protein
LKEVCEENKEYGNGRKTNGGNGDGTQEIHFSFSGGLVDYYTFDFGWEKFFNFSTRTQRVRVKQHFGYKTFCFIPKQFFEWPLRGHAKSTSNWQTLTVCVRTIFQHALFECVSNNTLVIKHSVLFSNNFSCYPYGVT